MRIISDFRDYYDSVQGQGFDDKVVYRRETRRFVHPYLSVNNRWQRVNGSEQELVEADVRMLPAFHEVRPRPHTLERNPWISSYAEAGMLYLAGRAYPFWTLTRAEDKSLVHSFEPAFAELVTQDEKPRRTYFGDRFTAFTPWKDWLADHWGREVDPAVHFRHGSPMVLYYADARIVDPCLREHDFQKALDPYTVFQEIDMFLGGVMADVGDPPSPQTDREKIASHGMDVKRSFRNMPRT